MVPLIIVLLAGCSHRHADPCSPTFLIESDPTNLDPRFGTDAQSQHIDGLVFSSLLERDDQMNFHGDLAESWETPDPLRYVFHFAAVSAFPDGRALAAADVKATLDFILTDVVLRCRFRTPPVARRSHSLPDR